MVLLIGGNVVLALALLLALPAFVWAHCLSATPTTQVPIYVNQFGYTAGAQKVAVATDPQTGYNAAITYTLPTALHVRRKADNRTVFIGQTTPWNGGATHSQSGDAVKWFDFSSLVDPGEYYVYDVTRNARSDFFVISDTAYTAVLRQVLRMYYYQRSGLAKTAPFTDAKWADGAAFLGTGQDTQARLITDPSNAGTAKDLRGGWFDAGDYNKYTMFATYALQDLLLAYVQYPSIWTDDLNIPESGNGIPDILDEVKWELDWLLKMQAASGNNSVLSKVAVTGTQATSPPSADTNPRYWGTSSTASTACSAGVFALGAIAFSMAGQTAYATTLENAAVAAWTWAQANNAIGYDNTGFTNVNPEPGTYGRALCQLQAAAFLYGRTAGGAYKTYFEANYTTLTAVNSTYWYGFAPDSYGQQAVLYYSTLAGVTAGVKTTIQNSKTSGIGGSEFYGAVTAQTDAYRAYMKDSDYGASGNNAGFGNNRVKASIGNLFLEQVRYNLDGANATNYKNAAAGYLYYIFGVNPNGIVYVTNMYAYGCKRCANEMAHAWFDNGTIWDNALTSTNGPPPGFMTGGANAGYTGTGLPVPPGGGQPPLKAYADFNTGSPQNAWEFTEPSISYQASLIHLLAHFVANP